MQRAATVDASFSAAWSAVIDLFSDLNWTIQTVDKNSGLIASDWLNVGDDFADCGSAPLARDVATQLRLNVRVKEVDGGTQVTVNTTYRKYRSFDGNISVVQCASLGVMESKIHAAVRRRSAAH